MLGGCTEEKSEGAQTLLEGKYPLEFTSQMYGMDVTRATSDNTWSGGEKIAIRVTGNEIKEYTISENNTGKITASSNVVPFYWTSINETKTVSAFYPYDLASANVISVKEAQNDAENYQASDALYAANSEIKFNNSPNTLLFKHLSAKVVVNLKAGDGSTDADLQGATVKFVNQSLTAPFNNMTGVVTAAPVGSSSVSPNVLDAPADGFQKSVRALLVPCQMNGKKFIEVAIGSKKYYYTPTNENDGKLESGKAYTYSVTVNRSNIEVIQNESNEWGNGGEENVQSSRGLSMSFTIDLTTGSDREYTIPFKQDNSGDYTLTVDWGDSSKNDTIKSGGQTRNVVHTYPEAKVYTITITTTQKDFSKAQIPGFSPSEYPKDMLKLKSLLTPLLNTGDESFDGLFKDCKNLTTITGNLFINNPQVNDFASCFENCNSLSSIPSGLFDKNTAATDFSKCFSVESSGNSKMSGQIPAKLFAKNLKAINFKSCFLNQTKLTINSDIFCEETEENMKNRFSDVEKVYFESCFKNVGSDQSVSDAAGTVPALWGYEYKGEKFIPFCFENIGKVTNAAEIPNDWK